MTPVAGGSRANTFEDWRYGIANERIDSPISSAIAVALAPEFRSAATRSSAVRLLRMEEVTQPAQWSTSGSAEPREKANSALPAA